MARVRAFLRHNKIYFETLGSVLPAVTAAVISIISLFVSYKALEISREQGEASQHEKRPYITAEIRLQFDDALRPVGSHVEIINYGELIRDLQMTVYEFLEITCLREGEQTKQTYLPIEGYYGSVFRTGNVTGVIAKLIPGQNFDEMGNCMVALTGTNYHPDKPTRLLRR